MMWKVPYESLRAPKQTGSMLIFFQLSERNYHCFCKHENSSFGKNDFARNCSKVAITTAA